MTPETKAWYATILATHRLSQSVPVELFDSSTITRINPGDCDCAEDWYAAVYRSWCTNHPQGNVTMEIKGKRKRVYSPLPKPKQ